MLAKKKGEINMIEHSEKSNNKTLTVYEFNSHAETHDRY